MASVCFSTGRAVSVGLGILSLSGCFKIPSQMLPLACDFLGCTCLYTYMYVYVGVQVYLYPYIDYIVTVL